MEAEHLRALTAARAVFEDGAVGDERIRKAHEDKFLKAIASRYGQIKGRKLAEAQVSGTDTQF